MIRTDHVSLKWLMSFKELEGQLARWLEKLQEFKFEIVYRGGRFHGNADGLSKWLCQDFGCEYCDRIEKKNAEATHKMVARIVVAQEDLEEWREAQRKDSSISFIIQGKETGRRPLHSEVPLRNISAQIYWSYWDSLVL